MLFLSQIDAIITLYNQSNQDTKSNLVILSQKKIIVHNKLEQGELSRISAEKTQHRQLNLICKPCSSSINNKPTFNINCIYCYTHTAV